jgi:hypothetical protein
MCQGILECEVLVGTRSAEGIMASGHVNRIKRPNTWLQRPMLQNREESSCQTGAVHTWQILLQNRKSNNPSSRYQDLRSCALEYNFFHSARAVSGAQPVELERF